jgi:D-arabinose 5-phosphate isomerase GutQ
MVTKEDVVLALSNSGESQELSAILPIIKRQGILLIAMTGNAQSTLAQHALIVLDSAVEKEACPMNSGTYREYHRTVGAWATPWRLQYSMRADSSQAILLCLTQGAAWAEGCSPMSLMS